MDFIQERPGSVSPLWSLHCSCRMSKGRPPSLGGLPHLKQECLSPRTNQYFLRVPGLCKHILLSYLLHYVFSLKFRHFCQQSQKYFSHCFIFFFFCSDLGHIYYLYHKFHFTGCKLDIIGLIGKSSYFA